MREVRQYGQPDKFTPRQNLFPEAHLQKTSDDYFLYIKENLNVMAENEDLSITEIHNLSPLLRNTCGMIILGQEWEYGISPQRMAINPDGIPEAIRNYKVKIKSLNGDSIRWKRGREFSKTKDYRSGSVKIFEDVWLDTESTECELPIQQAWKVLHQFGKYCHRANRKGLQDKFWKYEEISKKKVEQPVKTGKPFNKIQTVQATI